MRTNATPTPLSLPSSQELILRAQDSIERTRRLLDEFDERFNAFLEVQEKLHAERLNWDTPKKPSARAVRCA
jgi:hypothetical protein